MVYIFEWQKAKLSLLHCRYYSITILWESYKVHEGAMKVLWPVIGRKLLKHMKGKVAIDEKIRWTIKYVTIGPMARNVGWSKLQQEVASLDNLVCTNDSSIWTMVLGGLRQFEYTQLQTPSMEWLDGCKNLMDYRGSLEITWILAIVLLKFGTIQFTCKFFEHTTELG
jgi:hypothetical protein